MAKTCIKTLNNFGLKPTLLLMLFRFLMQSFVLHNIAFSPSLDCDLLPCIVLCMHFITLIPLIVCVVAR